MFGRGTWRPSCARILANDWFGTFCCAPTSCNPPLFTSLRLPTEFRILRDPPLRAGNAPRRINLKTLPPPASARASRSDAVVILCCPPPGRSGCMFYRCATRRTSLGRCYLGLVPCQDASPGRDRLGHITGDGADAAVRGGVAGGAAQPLDEGVLRAGHARGPGAEEERRRGLARAGAGTRGLTARLPSGRHRRPHKPLSSVGGPLGKCRAGAGRAKAGPRVAAWRGCPRAPDAAAVTEAGPELVEWHARGTTAGDAG